MFSSAKKNKSVSSSVGTIDTIIGVSSSMEGNINSNGIIRIDGKFKGDVVTKTDLIVGEQGYIEGNIIVNNASVSGKIEGNIKCHELLEILPTGRVLGDIEVASMAINEGAVFKGNCKMVSEAAEDIKLIESANEEKQVESKAFEIKE